MDAEKNITVTNLTNNKSFVISYSDKTITAPSIYELLEYQLNNKYTIDSNVEDIIDENEKTYFSDIVTLFDDITKEISDMAENIADESKETEEEVNNVDEESFTFTNDELW